jgi:hypothetical protein
VVSCQRNCWARRIGAPMPSDYDNLALANDIPWGTRTCPTVFWSLPGNRAKERSNPLAAGFVSFLRPRCHFPESSVWYPWSFNSSGRAATSKSIISYVFNQAMTRLTEVPLMSLLVPSFKIPASLLTHYPYSCNVVVGPGHQHGSCRTTCRGRMN